jgi:hypothetical protein
MLVQHTFKELHLLEYNRQKLEYLQAWKAHQMTQHRMDFFSLNLLWAFSDPYNLTGYNARPLLHDMVSKIFQEFMSGMWERESEEYLCTLSDK